MIHRKLSSAWGLAAVALMSLATAETLGAPVSSFQRNDEFIVSQSRAPLKRGYSTLATLPQGMRLRVLKVEGPWVGTAVVVNGRKVGGWVWAGQAATPRQYAALRNSVRRYSFSPTASFGAGGGYSVSPNSMGGARGVLPGQENPRRLIMGATNYGRSYWRADRKIMGY